MQISISASFDSSWLLLIIPLFVLAFWSLVYAAVRWANLDTPSLPRFSAFVDQADGGHRLQIANIGTGPAMDLAVGWADIAGEPFGQAPILLPHDTFSCDLPPVPIRTGTPSPSRRQGIEWLVVHFQPGPMGSLRRTRVPVRILDQPDERRKP